MSEARVLARQAVANVLPESVSAARAILLDVFLNTRKVALK